MDARIWSGRSLRRRGRTLQEIRAPWAGWPDNRHSTLLGHGIQRDRRQDRGLAGVTTIPAWVCVGRYRARRAHLALWTSQSYRRIRAPGLTRSGTVTPATCWCTGSRSTTCRHGFSCAIPSQGLEVLPQVRSGCSAGWTAAVDQRPSVDYDRHDCRIAEDIGRVIAMPHRFQLRRTTEQE